MYVYEFENQASIVIHGRLRRPGAIDVTKNPPQELRALHHDDTHDSKKNPCGKAIDILIMGSIPVIIIIFLLRYSMWSFLRHHRCSVPSCPPDVVDLPFSACQRRRLLIICLGKKPRTLRDFYWSVT